MAKVVHISKTGGGADISAIAAAFATLNNGEYTVTIKRTRAERSPSQNRLLWMWLRCIEDETGTPAEDCYKYYCHKFLYRYVDIDGRAVRIVDGSSELDTAQMARFLDQVRDDAITERHVERLPDPNDLAWDAFCAEYGE